MSSLQKFHRRTNNIPSGPSSFPYSPIGSGNNTVGYWAGTAGDGTSKLIISPNGTDTMVAFGSKGVTRNVTSTTNGLANTNTLYALGGHPAATAAKTSTQGGYNTWYVPAKDEMEQLYTNRTYATYSFITGKYYFSSTEKDANNAWGKRLGGDGNVGALDKSWANIYGGYYTRFVRRA